MSSGGYDNARHRMSDWLIPCSPDIYDAEAAFQEYGTIVWHQDCNMSAGDIAYLYVSAPVKAIRCKCRIEAVIIPADIGDDDGYVIDEGFCAKTHRRYMELRLEKIYDNPLLDYHALLMNGLSGPIRSQRRAPESLVDYFKALLGEPK